MQEENNDIFLLNFFNVKKQWLSFIDIKG